VPVNRREIIGCTVEFRILGPVDALDGGRSIPLPAGKPLTLLRILLLNRNRVVSAETLIDELWGDDPSESATKALQGYVSQLRKAIGPDRLITKPPGYSLRVEDGKLDLDRFEQLVREGRERLAAGDAKAASRELESALALWRGPAPGLEERRLAALEDRIDADLALARHTHLVAELETLVAEHPLRERLRGQLMLALYRSGRQADALEEYRRTRETLVDELGIEPSEELQELQRAILRHDPELEARRARPAAVADGPAPRRRLTWVLAVVAALALLVGAVVALAVTRGDGSPAASSGATELRTFVSRVENLLVQSRDGRRDVAAALSGVVHCRLGPHAAIQRLNRVQRNRQSLLQQVAALAVPDHAGAERSSNLFQQAEQRSIAADWHYRDWLAQRTTCGRPRPSPDLHDAWAADRAATRAKRQFVATFNPLARQFHRREWQATEF
jgi:DNA-binding SARP family transcriptional activator